MGEITTLLDGSSWESMVWQVLPALAGTGAKAAVILALAVGLSLALRRASAAQRHALWSASLLGVLALPLLAPALPAWHVPLLPAWTPPPAPVAEKASGPPVVWLPEAEARAAAEVPARRSEVRWEPSASSSLVATVPPAAPSPDVSAAASWPLRLLALWAGGVGLLLLWQLAGLARAWQLTRQARLVTDDAWQDSLAEAAGRLGLRRPVRLLASAAVAAPLTWGHRRPVVLLPAGAESWSRQRREVVLLHELAHIRRGDWLVRSLARLAGALHWFNPLVWLALRRLTLEQEMACDERVLALGTRPSTYAAHLLDVARAAATPGMRSPLLAVQMARRSQMEGRLMSILDFSHQRGSKSRIFLTILLTLLVVPTLAAMEPWAAQSWAALGAAAPSAADPAKAGDLRQVVAELSDLERQLEPFEAQLEAVEKDMESIEVDLEGVEGDFEPYESELEAIERQMEPYEERLAALEAQLEPYEGKMEAIEREIEPISEQLEREVEARMEAFEGRQEEIERKMEGVHAEMERVHESMEPLHEDLARIHEEFAEASDADRAEMKAKMDALQQEMEPLRQRLQALQQQAQPFQQQMQQLHQELQPLHQHQAGIHEKLEPHFDRLRALHEEMQPVHEQMAAVHKEMEPLFDQMRRIHERMEPVHQRMGEFHEKMEPHHRRMQEIHQKMEPIHRQMAGLHEQLESSLKAELEAVLRRELGSAAGSADLGKAAAAIADSASIQIRDGRLRLRTSAPEVRDLLRESLGSADSAALDRAARAISEFEIEVPER